VIQLHRLKPPTLFLIGSGIVACLLAGVLFYLYTDVNRRSQSIISLRGDMRSRLIAINSLSVIRDEYEALKPYLPQVDRLLPSQDELLNFPKNVSDIARTHRVEASVNFRGGAPAAATSTLSLRPIDFSLVAQGPLEGLFATLNDLEKSVYLIKFTSADLMRQEPHFRLTLSGQVFSR